MLLTAALAAVTIANPCTDPDRTVACPDLEMRAPYAMRTIPTRRGTLLAAANAIVNTGHGPLEVRARRAPGDPKGRMTTRQVLRPDVVGTAPILMPPSGSVTFFDTGTRGTYWKYEHAASFTLRPIAADGTVGRIRRTGPKVDYCFRDLRKVNRLDGRGRYTGTPRNEVFGACSTRADARELTLGTSVGWADIYPWRYPQNSIDVSGLSGCFLYTLKADPKDQLVELDETNNTGSAVVRLPWRGVGRRGCPAPVA